ncbi:hypothetical protein PT974_02948 [Cladobotryum mycophilum]|uniref:Cyanovirin-N domain-containing protein n=1 Tax=Cladobotryum mycophilum TaxID=491253 RepID=A0ABR0SZG8_9HYPO
MSFQATSRNYRLEGSVLYAECGNGNGSYVNSSLDLNQHIGNNDGAFWITKQTSAFYQSARDVQLQGTMLSATLRRNNGSWVEEESRLDLSFCVSNIRGKLTYQKPKESIINDTSMAFLEGPQLHALCLGYDGILHASDINLNEHYENHNGDLVNGRLFYNTASDVYLTRSQKDVLLHATLGGNHWNTGDFVKQRQVDVSINILNRGGQLVYERHDGFWDRDGPFATFCEKIPFVGYVVAGVQEAAGNEDQAKRAVAHCTESTFVCVGSLVGMLVGGPLGSMIGKAIATPIGLIVESAIGGTIDDPRIRGQFEEATFGKILFETIRKVLKTKGDRQHASKWLRKIEVKITKEALKELAQKYSEKSGTPAGEMDVVAATDFVNKLADALEQDEIPSDWINPKLPRVVEDLSFRNGGIYGPRHGHVGIFPGV